MMPTSLPDPGVTPPNWGQQLNDAIESRYTETLAEVDGKVDEPASASTNDVLLWDGTQWVASPGVAGPEGPQGDPGEAATVTAGTTTTVPTGSPADVTNSGTTSAAVFDFDIPLGDQGPVGLPGPPGPVGTNLSTVLNGTTYDLNPSKATEYMLTATASTSLTISGLSIGASVVVTLVQDGTGGHTITLPPDSLGLADVTLTTTANEYDVLVFWRSGLGTHVRHVQTGAVPASFWSPLSMSDQHSWFDASSLTENDGAAIATWQNQFGETDFTVTEGAPTKETSYRQFVRILSADSLDTAVFGSNLDEIWTIALLARWTSALPVTATRSVMNNANAISLNNIGVNSTNGGEWGFQNPALVSGEAVSGNWQTVLVVNDNAGAGTNTMRVDGTQAVGTGASAAWTKFRLNFNDENFDIAEIIAVAHVSDSTEIANIESYLNAKRDELNGL